jgi:hypothetical protein
VSATVADVLAGDARWCVVEGDSADVLRAMPDARFDAVVTDPPSGIAFMGAAWDRDKGGRLAWAAWLAGILSDARRATRDGGRAIVWSLPRTSHWTGCAVEDAGWSVESKLYHLFGSGWPKGKSQIKPAAEEWWLARTGRSEALSVDACRVGTSKSVPSSNAGAHLHEYFGGKPRGGTAEDANGINPNVGRYPPNLLLSHAAGCVCEGTRRVRGSNPFGPTRSVVANGYASMARGDARVPNPDTDHVSPDGTESVDAWRCVEGCPVAELDRQSGERRTGGNVTPTRMTPGYFGGPDRFGVPVDHGDTGTASRYFPQFPTDAPDAPWSEALFRYVAKPSRAERNTGCEGMLEGTVERYGEIGQGPSPQQTPRVARPQTNVHPTVKSVALMRWLIRLVTKPGDVVLDPFGGSGTTGVAALLEGRRVVLIEREPQYAAIARARCAAADGSDWTAPIAMRASEPPVNDVRQLGLFDGAVSR